MLREVCVFDEGNGVFRILVCGCGRQCVGGGTVCVIVTLPSVVFWTPSAQREKIEVDMVIDAALYLWSKCKAVFQKFQTGSIDNPRYLQKMDNPHKVSAVRPAPKAETPACRVWLNCLGKGFIATALPRSCLPFLLELFQTFMPDLFLICPVFSSADDELMLNVLRCHLTY